jgi:predicted transcriptional regulator
MSSAIAPMSPRTAAATADLGPLQFELMKRLWRRGSGTVHELLGDWPGRRPAYVTVLTVLQRLEKRGLLTHTVEERSFRYRPAIPEQAVKGVLLEALAQRLFGSLENLLAFATQALANGDGA